MADWDEVLNHPITAAGAGSFVALLFARKMTWLQAVFSWIAGLLCAHFLSPLAIAEIALAAKAPNATAFLVGAFGLQLVAMAYDVVLVVREDPKATAGAVIQILLERKGLSEVFKRKEPTQ